ncbi:tyrosine-type recombinase/integrase [Altererythrobacter sp. C41]|uniref:tyrosine-type recombinase/integrase n=1 Tax=Altererythrobacter sp. C41 TaxID=2806021 RepID=UPI00193231E9|nr:integrase arm-type DNA-binding domain-containing protein [Altererythrobacter sp. C41]MBM0169689.1 site-specific integrase [Altererythrobacter sp. C41]
MATGNITITSVTALHPGAKDKLLWDEKLRGFGLKVTPAGSRIYLYQYRMGGRGSKVRRYTIGKHGSLTPDQARKEAKRLAMLVTQGIDPQTEKKERRRVVVDLAFSSYLDRFVSDCLKVSWKASADEVEAMLRAYALPEIGNKPLPDIRRGDISAVLRPLRDKPASASKLFAVLRRLFRWAISEGDLETSPMAAMEAPTPPKSRDRTLGDDELVTIWRASETIGYPFGPMVRLLVLWGARRNEVAGLPWAELSRAERLWSLPASRAKNGEAVSYHISELAFAELEALAKRAGKSGAWPRRGFVFSTTGDTPVSGYSRAKRRLDAACEKANHGTALPHWTLHDLRRTLATGMQRLGVRFEVTEAILNHRSGSRAGVAGIYQRHHWGPEKKAALDAWSRHISTLLDGADETNIVAISARAHA